MYTKENSQQTFKIPNNNLDVRFEWAHKNHNTEIVQTRKNNEANFAGGTALNHVMYVCPIFHRIHTAYTLLYAMW